MLDIIVNGSGANSLEAEAVLQDGKFVSSKQVGSIAGFMESLKIQISTAESWTWALRIQLEVGSVYCQQAGQLQMAHKSTRRVEGPFVIAGRTP